MAVLITISKPPATSEYDQWKIYRSTSIDGAYSLIKTQAITDLTYYDTTGSNVYWYKLAYYESTTEVQSTLSDAIQGQSTVYTTVKKVESFMQIAALTDSSNPTIQETIEMIKRMEDIIDQDTGHAWRLRYSGTKSASEQEAVYEEFDISNNYEYQTGRPIYLKHRKVREFDSDEGDVLQIWDGASWIDWLEDKSEGRGDDFWVSYPKGIVFIKSRYGVKKPMAARIKYRYGENVVPGMISDLATKMMAVELATGNYRSVILPEGDGGFTRSQRIEMWERKIDAYMTKNKEFQVPQALM